MGWGDKVSATQLTSITVEQFFDTTLMLNPGELAHCKVDYDGVASPTDDLIVAVYGALEETSEEWDDEPLMEFTVPFGAAGIPNQKSFMLTGVYKARVGVRRSGTTDTIPAADFAYRKDGVSA